MHKDYWIAESPEDATYKVYFGGDLICGGFESLSEAWQYIDEMEA